MFEEKVAEMIKDEVAKAVSGLMTEERLEKVVTGAITKIFEPLARKQEIAAMEYIAEKDVGELFPIAPSTLKTWRCRKMSGPPYKKIGDRIIYKISDLHDFFSPSNDSRD